MNDVQKKAFEMLRIFIDICEKWNIKYYLLCGSALGAVKYQGFIPWDDDIDVGLLRKDYRRFLEVAPKELPEWCFLQNYSTDPANPFASTKLRNSNTTFLQISVAHLPINHGIFIDVFPLDGYPQGCGARMLFELRKKILLWKCFCSLSGPEDPKVRFRNKVFRILGYHRRTPRTLEKLENLYSQYPPEESDLWCNYCNSADKQEYAPRWHYGEGAWATFEGLRVRIPERYDAYLTQKYGDWRSDLPEEKKCSQHLCVVCDAQTPFTEYTQKQ